MANIRIMKRGAFVSSDSRRVREEKGRNEGVKAKSARLEDVKSVATKGN